MSNNTQRSAVIVAATRTAVGKAQKGTTRNWRSDDMMADVIKELIKQASIEPTLVDDVIVGCAMPEGSQGLNFARAIALHAGLPNSVSGVTVNRFCSSGLQTIAMAAERIIANGADCIIAGGAETMSLVPMTGYRFSPNETIVSEMPEVYMSMGLTAEQVAKEYNISREDQDAFALESHRRAAVAIAEDRFAGQIVTISTEEVELVDGKPTSRTIYLSQDEHVRPNSTLEGLANLPPAFTANGSVTAGNASPLSDGAAGVMVMEEQMAKELGLTPLARFIGFAVAGVRPEVMGIGPIEAIPKLLKRTGLSLDEIDLIELNEAFAAQSLAVIRELGLDTEKVNVNGGALALGHPLGCTGAKLTVQLIHELKRRNGRYGMVTMCIGGGMGAAGIFEVL